jgi:hypothetical protein
MQPPRVTALPGAVRSDISYLLRRLIKWGIRNRATTRRKAFRLLLPGSPEVHCFSTLISAVIVKLGYCELVFNADLDMAIHMP